jgi:hypothetical protein
MALMAIFHFKRGDFLAATAAAEVALDLGLFDHFSVLPLLPAPVVDIFNPAPNPVPVPVPVAVPLSTARLECREEVDRSIPADGARDWDLGTCSCNWGVTKAR